MLPIIVSSPDANIVAAAKTLASALIPRKSTELKREPSAPVPLHINENDEHLADDRDSMRPSEFVQRKLQSALYACPVPVSMMHSKRFVRRPSAANIA